MMDKFDSLLQKSRKSVLVIAFILCSFGMYSVIHSKKELIPKTDYRKYNLEILYPNASPIAVETIVTQPIVSGLLSKKEVHTIYSHSAYGISKITFELNQNNMYIIQDFIDKLSESFPKEVQSSKLKEVINGEKSILKILIPLENNYLVSEVQKELSSLGGLAIEVEGTPGAISLEYDEKRLSHSGIPKRELREILKQETKKSPIGTGIESGRLLPIQSQGLFSNGIESSLSALKPSIKSLITIEKKDDFQIMYDGKKGILISIYPITSEFSPTVVSDIKKILQQIRIEKGLDYKIIYDKYEEISNVFQDFILGIGFVFICGTFFVSLIINDKRIISLVFFILIISILLIFLVHSVLKISLTMYSLMGISMGIGLLFDIANTIFITIQSTKNKKTILEHLKSIYKSSLYSTLTSIVVLIPLLDLHSRIGTMYNNISVSFIITLSINIIVTYTVVYLYGSRYVGSPKKYDFGFLASFQLKLPLAILINKNRKLKKSLLKSRSLLFISLFSIIVVGCTSLFLTSKEIYPPLGEKQIRISISQNESQNYDPKMSFLEFDEYLSKQPKIQHRIGKYAKDSLEWFVEFSGNDSKAFIEEIFKGIPIKRGYLDFENLQSFTDDTSSMSLLLLIYKEEDVLPIYNLLERFSESKKVLQIHSGTLHSPEVYIPKSERFFISSLQNGEFIDSYTDLSSFQISYFDETTGSKQLINLDKQVEKEKTESLIWRGIPAREYFHTSVESEEPSIYSKNGRRYYPIYLQISKENDAEIRKSLENYFKSGNLEEIHDKDSEKIIGELLFSLYYSILYLFILLFFAYQSFSKSIYILSTLLFVDSFAFLGLYVFGASLNSGSFLGILFLSGISVDSIILFLEKKSHSLKSIYKIVIVNLFTTLLGMLSLLIIFGDKQFQSTIALSVLFGLLGLFIYFTYFAKPIYQLFIQPRHSLVNSHQTTTQTSKKRLFLLQFLIVTIFLFSASKYSLRSIPETLPKGVKIEWIFPSGAQAVLEQKVAQPIETILSKLDGIEGSETHIEYGYLRMQIKFKENANHKNLYYYLHRELSELQKQFPPEYPKIHLYSLFPEEEPDMIFRLNIESLSKDDQIQFIKKEVIPKLKTLWGVRHVSLFGESQLETKIQYDRKKITNANLSPPDFMASVTKYLEVSRSESNQKIVNPIRIFDPSFLQLGFVVQKGKLFFQDIMKAYKENKSKSILHRLNGEESLGVTIHIDSIYSGLYFYIGLHFLHLPKNLEIQTIYHSFQNIVSIYLQNRYYLILPFVIYLLRACNQKKSSKNILPVFVSSFFSFLLVILIYKYIDLAIIYGIGFSFLILSISNPRREGESPHLKWTFLLFSIYIVVTLFPIEYKELYLSSFYCAFLFINSFWIFYTYTGEPAPIKSLLIRYFFFTFYKQIQFINKLRSTLKPLNRWTPPTWKSKYNLLNIVFSIVLVIVSIVYLFFPGLPPLFLPALHGDVLIGNLDLPTGTPMSTTNFLSLKVEKNLYQSTYFENIYVKILNERSKFYLQLKNGNLPDKNYMKTISGLGSPGYFYLPSESFREGEVLEVDFFGGDILQIWNCIQKFQSELQKKSPEIEIIYKFKIPSHRLDLLPSPSRFMVSGIYPSLLSTILNTNSGIVSRVYTDDKLMDIRLEEDSRINDRKKYLNEFSSFKTKQYLPSHYFLPKSNEDFSVLRKVNGQLVLSILLLEKEHKKQPFFGIPNTFESVFMNTSYLYSITNPILETLQKQNSVKSRIQTKKKSITSSVLCICIGLFFLFYSKNNPKN